MRNFQSILILSALLASCDFIPNHTAELSGTSVPSPSYKETSIPPQTMISYDRDGVKTGSYKKSGTTINQYDQYGKKIGTYKTNTTGVTTSYDKYGRKTGSFKEDASGRISEYDKNGRKIGSYKQKR